MSAPDSGYKFGNKNQWRRTIWNRITERLTVRPSEAIVLYLAGPDNLDRDEMLRRGFAARNIIAIDRNARIVSSLRGSGQLAINADFVSVMQAWNYARDVHVVFGDFCCGLEQSRVASIIDTVFTPPFASSVCAFNFMRGRDSSSNASRAAMAPFVVDEDGNDASKHRGAQFFAMLSMTYAAQCDDPDLVLKRYKRWLDITNNHVLTYRSTSFQTFDSVVWVMPWQNVLSTAQRSKLAAHRAATGLFKENANVRRKLAAVLAHRTMRERA